MQKEAVEKKQDKQVLTFNLLNEELGLDITYVREVLKPLQIHHLPAAPDFIEGVVNLRGHIIAVLDLRKKFNIKTQDLTPGSRVIVCKIKKFIVGLVVDSVSGVVSLSKADIQPTPEILSMQVGYGYVSGMARLGERVITLLDLEEVLTKEEITRLSNMAGVLPPPIKG